MSAGAAEAARYRGDGWGVAPSFSSAPGTGS